MTPDAELLEQGWTAVKDGAALFRLVVRNPDRKLEMDELDDSGQIIVRDKTRTRAREDRRD